MKRHVATPLMMLQEPGCSPAIIPFQKGGKRFSLPKFLEWAAAGDTHPGLEDVLTASLLNMVVTPSRPVRRAKGGVVTATPPTLTKAEVDTLLSKEKRKWQKEHRNHIVTVPYHINLNHIFTVPYHINRNHAFTVQLYAYSHKLTHVCPPFDAPLNLRKWRSGSLHRLMQRFKSGRVSVTLIPTLMGQRTLSNRR